VYSVYVYLYHRVIYPPLRGELPSARYIVSPVDSLSIVIIRLLCYSNTTVYYGIHKRSGCVPVDSGVTNLIHDRRSCVDFTLEVEANVARCVHSSVNKPGMKRNSGL